MEVSVKVHKIIKCTIYIYSAAFFYFRWRCWCCVGEVVLNGTYYQGCQSDEHFIQCQISTDALGIVN